MVIYHPSLINELKHKTLFLDTNVFSTAFRQPELINFLIDLRENECALATIPSVLFEVTRGSKDLLAYNQRAEALGGLVSFIDPLRWTAQNIEAFSVVMAQLVNAAKSQYTDFLLSTCLYHYRHAGVLLMTTDLQSMPPSIFDRKFVVTSERDDEIRNFGIFELNEDHYELAAGKLI